MKQTNAALRDLRSKVSKALERFSGQVRCLSNSISPRDGKCTELDTESKESIHCQELNEQVRVTEEVARREDLSDKELNAELVTQYGTTRWATRLIRGIMAHR